MDLLESLNIDDLPEQQTRTVHLLKDHPDFNLKLGFDCCCVCGKPNPKIECQECHRVNYCSKECCHKDNTQQINDNNEEGEEQALGHTSVICALLGLCNDDEAVEDDPKNSKIGKERLNAAKDRLASEFESYPATLANIIMEGPCYQDTLEKCTGESLTIHVIGASEDSELWQGHPDPSQERKVFDCYADALAEIAESYKIQCINLHFFGPACPKRKIDRTVVIPQIQQQQGKKSSSRTAKLHVQTRNEDYNLDNNKQSSPDIIVFFNPGFTCPDYDWEKSLSCVKKMEIPFLVTTNTEVEAIADLQYLMDREILFDIPPGLNAILQMNSDEDDGGSPPDDDEDADDCTTFLSLNPYAGNRVRQSGTMANDLYVKSRWVFGGISSTKLSLQTKKRETPSSSGEGLAEGNKKKRRVERSGNTKKTNPALV
jgi:hypothetical protein